MYKRDAIALLSATLIALSILLQEKTLSFENSWFYSVERNEDTSLLPLPVLVDLNGDGQNEVVLTTSNCKIQIVSAYVQIAQAHSFTSAIILAEVNLKPLAWPKEYEKAKRAVSLEVGVVEPTGDIVKQVIVAVLADWSVLCFDHNLKLKWSTNIKNPVPHGPYGWAGLNISINEVAVAIYPGENGSKSLVIIGGSTDYENLDADSETTFTYGVGFEGKVHSADRNFTYIALDGQTGHINWQQKVHQSKDEGTLNVLESQFEPHYSPKIYNKRCFNYNDILLSELPHSWKNNYDTNMRVVRYIKSMNSNRFRPHEAKSNFSLPESLLDEVISALPAKQQMWKETFDKTHAIITHRKNGIDFLNLDNDVNSCTLKMNSNAVHADIDKDGVVDHIQVLDDTNLKVLIKYGLSHQHIFDIDTSSHQNSLLKKKFQLKTVNLPVVLFPHSKLFVRKFGIIFFLSEGVITAMNHLGKVLWQRSINLKFYEHDTTEGEFYLLHAIKLDYTEPNMLFITSKFVSIIMSPSGTVLSKILHPATDHFSLIIGDFNGDGFDDLLLVNRQGLSCYLQYRRLNKKSFSIMIALMFLIMIILYYLHIE